MRRLHRNLTRFQGYTPNQRQMTNTRGATTWFSQIITRESQKTFWMNSDHMNIDSHNIVFVQHLKTSHCHTHVLNKNHQMDQKSSATGTQTKHPHSTMFEKTFVECLLPLSTPKISTFHAGNTFNLKPRRFGVFEQLRGVWREPY